MLRCDLKRGKLKDGIELKLLQQFWASAGNVSFDPPLSQHEAVMLQQIGTMR